MIAIAKQKPVEATQGYRLLRIATGHFGRALHDLDDEEQKQVQRIAVNEMQLEHLILTSPESHQVTVPESQVEAALQQIRNNYEETDHFYESLSNSGLSEEMVRAEIRDALRVEAVMDLVASRGVAVDNTEATLFYYLHPEKFEKPEVRKARHILITENSDYKENSESESLRRIQAIGERLQQHPKRFAEQALKHSECPTGLNGGVLGQVPKGVLYPELDAVLYTMKEGEISSPVQSELGWHLLYCEEVISAHTLPLAKVLPELREELQNRQNKRTQKTWLKHRAAAISQ
ncbi:nitrogen fixation protein NifM [Thalassolituus sp.]|jgi:nitrogen fixation protein NifM|uniref:nitrogen fixation protein NifM n=1 Tax=Thalassolituus sp. TaxID=2030822 RepID=UPI002A81B61B|nr:nitrogen fixation protein NifM [Thalassolituus sp.]|tara:strand:- start:4030 stop:4899 length:870 start_codon:yes stop_codon:yes gene_type:complete